MTQFNFDIESLTELQKTYLDICDEDGWVEFKVSFSDNTEDDEPMISKQHISTIW